MEKRGQLSLFLVVGVVLLLVAGLFMVSKGTAPKTQVASLESEGVAIQGLVNSCVKQKFLESKDVYGLKADSKPQMETYVDSQLPLCVNLDSFEERGLRISAGLPETEVTISEDAALATVKYPLRIKSPDTEISLNTFSYYMKPESKMSLLVLEGRTQREAVKVTEDGKAELRVYQGTRVYKDGAELTEVSLKVRDKKFDGLQNGVVLGETIYEGLPSGASFEPGAEITIKYSEEDIPIGVEETDLSVGHYDEQSGLWISLESQIDIESNKVTARVPGFSKIAIIFGCGGTEETEQTTFLGYIYKSPCQVEGMNSCPAWALKKDETTFARSINDAKEGKAFAIDGQGPTWGPIFAVEQNVKKDEAMQALAIGNCEKRTWDASTGETYGYAKVEHAGSRKEAKMYEFNLLPDGNSCMPQNKLLMLKVECDDECTDFKLNGQAAKEAKSDGNKYTVTFDTKTLKAKVEEFNEITFTVKNKFEACSWAKGELILPGKGLYEKCPESNGLNDFIPFPCTCGNKNIGPRWNIDESKELIEKVLLAAKKGKEGKKQVEEVAKEIRKMIEDASASNKLFNPKLYCYKGEAKVEGEERMAQVSGGASGTGSTTTNPAVPIPVKDIVDWKLTGPEGMTFDCDKSLLTRKRCNYEDPKKYQVCEKPGKEWATKDCPEGKFCVAGECSGEGEPKAVDTCNAQNAGQRRCYDSDPSSYFVCGINIFTKQPQWNPGICKAGGCKKETGYCDPSISVPPQKECTAETNTKYRCVRGKVSLRERCSFGSNSGENFDSWLPPESCAPGEECVNDECKPISQADKSTGKGSDPALDTPAQAPAQASGPAAPAQQAPTPCTNGKRRCKPDTTKVTQECVNSQWKDDQATCSNTESCAGGDCNPEPKEKVSQPGWGCRGELVGSRRCTSDSTQEVCARNGWEQQPCDPGKSCNSANGLCDKAGAPAAQPAQGATAAGPTAQTPATTRPEWAAFSKLMTNQPVVKCCENAEEIYHDVDVRSNTNRDNCEIVVCKKGEFYTWAYTGNEIANNVQKENNQKCKGIAHNVNVFLMRGCGVVPTGASPPAAGGAAKPPAAPAAQPATQKVCNIGDKQCNGFEEVKICESVNNKEDWKFYKCDQGWGCNGVTKYCEIKDCNNPNLGARRCADKTAYEECTRQHSEGQTEIIWKKVQCGNKECARKDGKVDCFDQAAAPAPVASAPAAAAPGTAAPQNPADKITVGSTDYFCNSAWSQNLGTQICENDKLLKICKKLDDVYYWEGRSCSAGCDKDKRGCKDASSAPAAQPGTGAPAAQAPPTTGPEIINGYDKLNIACGYPDGSSYCGQSTSINLALVNNAPDKESYICFGNKWYKRDCSNFGGCENGLCKHLTAECPKSNVQNLEYKPNRAYDSYCEGAKTTGIAGKRTCIKDSKDQNNQISIHCDQRGNACATVGPCICDDKFECQGSVIKEGYYAKDGEECGWGFIFGYRDCVSGTTCFQMSGVSPKGVCIPIEKNSDGKIEILTRGYDETCFRGANSRLKCDNSKGLVCHETNYDFGAGVGRCVKGSGKDKPCEMHVDYYFPRPTPSVLHYPDCGIGLKCHGPPLNKYCIPT